MIRGTVQGVVDRWVDGRSWAEVPAADPVAPPSPTRPDLMIGTALKVRPQKGFLWRMWDAVLDWIGA